MLSARSSELIRHLLKEFLNALFCCVGMGDANVILYARSRAQKLHI